MHFEEVGACLKENQINRFQQHQGRKPLGCFGGLSMSLDLSKAYDLASRPIIYHTLASHGVSQDVISAIKQLHCDAQYIFRSGPNIGRHTTTNGLKQGCCIAPFLWSFYTVAVMQTLKDRLGPEWLQHALILFADDHWCQWIIRSKADFETSLAQLTVVLETLLDYKMSVNYKKTAILLRLEGRQAKAVLREHTRMKNGETHLCVRVKGEEQLIPVKETHEHLGTKVTYHHRLDRNLGHRLQAGQTKYQAIRKTLNGHHALHVSHRLRLWSACVRTSQHYSLAAVGFTRSGLAKLTIAATRHIRAIQRSPAHLTHTTNNHIWQQAGLSKPGQALLQALQRFKDALHRRTSTAPDITTRADVQAHVGRLEVKLIDLLQQQEQQDAQLPVTSAEVPCPYCDAVFDTENAMRTHAQLAHNDLPPRAASTPTQFVPRLHACGGLPQCRLCLRTFYRWQNLKEHIESGACDKLGGESLTKHPVKTDSQALAVQPSCEDHPPDTATGVSQNVPLCERLHFARRRHDWEALLRDPKLHNDLQSHCTLCHMWVASFRHVKQHICKVHEPETPGLHNKALALCLSFKQHLVRDHQCPWCKRKVWAPARHSQQCVVLYQLCVAKIRLELTQDDRPLTGPQSGGRHLRLLQPHSPAVQDTAIITTTAEGQGDRGAHGGLRRVHAATKEAQTRAEHADGIQATVRLQSSTPTTPTQEQRPLSGSQTHGPDAAVPRGPTSGTTDGQGLRPVHASVRTTPASSPISTPFRWSGMPRRTRGPRASPPHYAPCCWRA